jgi:hypothetical protein
LRSTEQPNSIARQFDFHDDRYEWRRLFAEVLGAFFLVLVAVGAGMVNTRFGGQAVPYGARVVAPGLMGAAIILFMGTVSGAHLNPAVSVAFALRGDFPWKRVPAYIAAQFAGAVLATLLLWALIGKQGSAGLTPAGQWHHDDHRAAVGGSPDRRSCERDPGNRVRGAATRPARRDRRRQLYRARRVVGSAGERCLDESGQIARPRPPAAAILAPAAANSAGFIRI